MATANVITKQFHTFLIAKDAGDTILVGNFHGRLRNFSDNKISISEVSAPTGEVTAGQQATLMPLPVGGLPDEVILRPATLYYVTANSAASLVCFDELPRLT